ncbi:hypothetical protein C8A00DRAFT_37736 [Chaetomidium leptoderma]|uniref:HNH nuclease domain-containing protein n=1 Tax=Chaetomidium leptoderma TaxID=669021 RepID=A0AAN6ZRZ8_9PEZI|nr:hypothetical protein C8A00DRAFT_37736 [Chaetomidium leptoderma]
MDTHCPDNLLRLRKDVHTLLGAHRFAFVPKRGACVVHVLEVGETDEPLVGVRRQYMLARFAIAVLDKSMFARQPSKGLRRLVWNGVRGEEPEVKELSAKQCRAIFGAGARGKSSSWSPSKRGRAEGDGNGDDDGDENASGVRDDGGTVAPTRNMSRAREQTVAAGAWIAAMKARRMRLSVADHENASEEAT